MASRTLLRGIGATAAVGGIGMPAILRAADQGKIGFMAPAMSEVEIDVPHGKLTVDAASNHARNGTLIARATTRAAST
jgi:hypothetical protein